MINKIRNTDGGAAVGETAELRRAYAEFSGPGHAGDISDGQLACEV